MHEMRPDQCFKTRGLRRDVGTVPCGLDYARYLQAGRDDSSFPRSGPSMCRKKPAIGDGPSLGSTRRRKLRRSEATSIASFILWQFTHRRPREACEKRFRRVARPHGTRGQPTPRMPGESGASGRDMPQWEMGGPTRAISRGAAASP
jgi:hypothetical protein